MSPRLDPPTPARADPGMPPPSAATIDALADFVARHPRLFVLTGAGVSTGSGIPDYRDNGGAWKRRPPVQFQEFVDLAATRRRYWARSLVGWRAFAAASPNLAHLALTRLERTGRIIQLVTQNVDRLHQRAGSDRVIDLHGRLDRITCLDCGTPGQRSVLQARLEAANTVFAGRAATMAPDGDADLEDDDLAGFSVPDCPACGGLLKPDVVFFGENVPPKRVENARDALAAADAMLVVGSSLMVFSGFRFARLAAERGLPVAAINLGRTRADDLLSLKVGADCGAALDGLLRRLDDAG